jgi:hypothetical protein
MTYDRLTTWRSGCVCNQQKPKAENSICQCKCTENMQGETYLGRGVAVDTSSRLDPTFHRALHLAIITVLKGTTVKPVPCPLDSRAEEISFRQQPRAPQLPLDLRQLIRPCWCFKSFQTYGLSLFLCKVQYLISHPGSSLWVQPETLFTKIGLSTIVAK